MISRLPRLALVSILAGALCACGSSGDRPPEADADAGAEAPGACVITADDDGDCIGNGAEGCTLAEPADRDSDGVPNHLDEDADGDGVGDRIEVGPDCARPRDTDGDSLVDYLDEDSDNDSVPDGYEDRNGDGRVGTCRDTCTTPDDCDPAPDVHCSLAIDGSGGTCVSLACLGSESDPRNGDSDADGTPDAQEGTFVCNPRDDVANPFGLAPISYIDARSTSFLGAGWRIGVAYGAKRGEVVLTTPAVEGESAYALDFGDSVAGFLATRPASELPDAVTAVSTAGVSAIAAVPGLTQVLVRSAGVPATAPGGADAIVRTTLIATARQPMTAAAVRDAVLPALLARAPGTVTVPALDADATGTAFVITFQTVLRRDPTGAAKPVALYMGAVVPQQVHDDPASMAAFQADDLSNGSALAPSGADEATECLRHDLSGTAAVDMVWVVSESASAQPARARLAGLAGEILAQAKARGLDIRMGVTDMRSAAALDAGRFATRAAGGTGDRWLLASDGDAFAAALRDPSGPDPAAPEAHYGLGQAAAAVARHLPRSASDAQRIRPDAALVIVLVTGDKPQEVEDATSLADGDRSPTTAEETAIAAVLAPYRTALAQEGAQVHLIAEPLPFDEPACAGAREHAYGYYPLAEITGGVVGSICQEDLAPTVSLLLDAVAARVSPVSMPHRPITASLAVTRDHVLVPRSRSIGWSYGAGHDTVLLFGQPSDPDAHVDVVVGYRRWVLPAQ